MEVQDEHRDAEEEGQSNHPILVDEYDRSVRRRTADVPRQRTPVTFDSKDSKEDSSDAEPYTQKDLMRMVVSLQSHMDTLVAQNKGLMEQAAAAREDLTMRDAAYNELLTELATYREQAQRRRQSGVASHLITPAVTLNVAQVQTTVAEPTGTSSFSPPPTVSAEVRKQVQKKLEKFQPWQPSPSADATRLVTWLSRYELWVRNAGGDEQLMLEFIGEHLDGPAFDWHRHLSSTSEAKTSWPKFKDAIRDQFQPSLPLTVVTQRLHECTKSKQESYPQHLTRFQHILADLPPGTLSSVMLHQIYLRNIDRDVRYELRSRHQSSLNSVASPPSVAELCQWAMAVEHDLTELHDRPNTSHKPAGSGDTLHHVSTQTSSTTTTTTAPSTSSTPRLPNVSANYKGKHPDPNYPQHRGHSSTTGGIGAKRTISPPPLQAPPASNPSNVASSTSGHAHLARTCYNCGQPGHYRHNCPLPRGQQGIQAKREK